MANYFVSKSGNDSNAGTSTGAPKLTIDSAWQAVAEGDSIIIIDSGTYSGSDNTALSSRNIDNITIKADDGTHSGAAQSPIIDGGGSAAYFVRFDENYTFSGLTFINFAAGGAGILTHRTGSGLTTLTITDCIFRDNTGRIIECDEIDDHTIIERCQFYNNTAALSTDNAIQIAAGTNRVTLKNSLFYNIGPKNIAFIMVDAINDNTSITHCTFAKRNTGVSQAAQPQRLFRIGGGDFKYNIVYEFDATQETILATAGGDVQYNAYGSETATWSGSNGPVNGVTPQNNLILTGDPGFLNYSGNDYRLGAAAQSIVLDTASGSTETVDITNGNRATLDASAFDTGIRDMGAYEGTGFWSAESSEIYPQIDGDFTINRNLNVNTQWQRAGENVSSTWGGGVQVAQLPFSVAVNGNIPTLIRQRPGAYVMVTGGKKEG
tara:strand:- start:1157 stop:2461 length:1305 start_codon:yes stop_codon:yes gene_type:complete